MARDSICETIITIDHDEGIILIDTTARSMAAELRRCGFVEKADARSCPYRRFKGTPDQIRLRQPKAKRTLRGAVKACVKALPDSVLAA